MTTTGTAIEEKLNILRGIIRGHAPVVVAFSGGVDSSLLAILAEQEIGSDRVVCLFLDGPEVPRTEAAAARQIAETYHLPLRVLTTMPLSPEIMAENPHDRCRHCKLGIFPALQNVATEIGAEGIFDGANASDLSEHRPGIDAFTSCGVLHPFIMAGITKQDIREIAKSLDIPFWNKPSAACLFSRIPYGTAITEEKLRMIETAEEYLKQIGFSQVRVRHHGDIARIEVLPAEFANVIAHREKILSALKAAGFVYVSMDLTGYRPGSMDEAIGE